MAEDSLGTDHALPYERAATSPAEPKASLFAALESEISDEAGGEDEPAAPERAERPEAEPEEEATEQDPDAEPEDESEEEGEPDEEAEEPEAEPTYRVKVDGKEVEVSLQELREGYSRTSDYTRKTQAVAEVRKQAEAEVSQTRAVRDQYAERLEALTLAHKSMQPKEPDWDKLREENPTQYAVLRADQARWKEEQREFEAEQRRVYEDRLADHNRQRTAFVEEQKAKLTEAIPEWKDEAKSKAERAKLADYLAETYGYTQADLDTVEDHRLMVALRKAMLYDEGQTKGKEKIAGKLKPAVAPLKAGNRERSPRREDKAATKSARAKLARTGRVDDAAEYLKTFLPDL